MPHICFDSKSNAFRIGDIIRFRSYRRLWTKTLRLYRKYDGIFVVNFLTDRSQGVEKTYADLLEDVASVTEIPPVIRPLRLYDFFVTLLAALRTHASIILAPEVFSDSELDRIRAIEYLHPKATPRVGVPLETPQDIRKSVSQIGVVTSGSGGRPSIVWHRMSSMLRGIIEGDRHCDDVWGLAYHPAHFAGLQVFFQAVVNRNSIVRLFGLDGKAIKEAIELNSVTHISATPTFLRLVCPLGSDVFPKVRRVTIGGERLDTSLKTNLTRVFPNAKLRNVYASTEAGTVLLAEGETFKIPPEKSDMVRLVDSQLAIHQSLLADSFRESLAKDDALVDGFYLTGDFVEAIGSDGGFRFLPRHDQLINVGGYKVNSADVEQALRQLPEIADTIVYGVGNSVMGSVVACDVVLRPSVSLTARDIRSRLRDNLSPYQLPVFVNIVPALQTTYSGKRVARS
jgi:acyl-coenzyme A synthetase/AMP-(fatty) acid ligase